MVPHVQGFAKAIWLIVKSQIHQRQNAMIATIKITTDFRKLIFQNNWVGHVCVSHLSEQLSCLEEIPEIAEM